MMKNKLLFATLVSAALAGCAGTQPTTYTPPLAAEGSPQAVAGCPNAPARAVDGDKQVIGAVVGAVVGAVAGKAISKKDGGAVVGAGLGGLFGYLIGTDIAVKEQADGSVMLDIPGAALFDVNKTDIKPSFAQTLSRIAGTLKENPGTVVCVIGYTDSTGSFEYNQNLSLRRAQSVTSFLANQGVTGSRLTPAGLGPRFPVASNDSEAGRSQNRRVELYVRK